LVGQMHLWHQIGFPAAYIVFGFFFSHGISQQCSLFFLVGSIFGTLIVFLHEICLNRGLTYCPPLSSYNCP
jgi:hypothetical protein